MDKPFLLFIFYNSTHSAFRLPRQCRSPDRENSQLITEKLGDRKNSLCLCLRCQSAAARWRDGSDSHGTFVEGLGQCGAQCWGGRGFGNNLLGIGDILCTWNLGSFGDFFRANSKS